MTDLIEQALAALRSGKYARAVAIADQLAVDMPEDPLVRSIRAQGLLHSNDPEAALAEAHKAVELDPTNAHTLALLGYAAWRAERPTLAQASFEAAIKYSGGDSFFLTEYAWFLANNRPPKAAETAARNAIEANDASSTAWAALGLAQFRMHRQADAETSLRRALSLNPNDIYAQSAMVALLQEQGKEVEAQALAGLLTDHVGAEDLATSLREESQERKIAAMLVERNIDLNTPVADSHLRHWLAMIAAAAIVGGFLYYLSPDRPWLVIIATLMPLALIGLILWIWR
jgi:Tfp pilus assembly protein PilF